jgi:hypothetical protein
MTTATEQELITQAVLDYYEGWFDGDPAREVDDVYGDIASVTARAAPYYEYLHLVRTRDGWKIANVLFQAR